MGSFNRSYYWYDANKGFSWARYLECMSAKAAPARAFAQPPLPQVGFGSVVLLKQKSRAKPGYLRRIKHKNRIYLTRRLRAKHK